MKKALSLVALLSGVLFLSPSNLSGQAGNAINFQNSTFDSHGDFIYCGQPNFGFTDKLTVATWVKWTTDPGTFARTKTGHLTRELEGEYSTYLAYATHNTLDYSTEHGQFWLRNMKTGNHFEFTVENSSGTKKTVTSSTNPSSGTWYFLVGTYDGSTVKLYVNGTQEGSGQSLSGNIRANTDCRLNMGRLPWGYGVFVGYLDEARVWNIALTQTEIQDQMVSKTTIQDANCKSYWNFDAGSGTTISDSKGLANGVFYSALTDVHAYNTSPVTITDSDRAFVTGTWDGKMLYTVAGAGVDETNMIVSNTGNVFTLNTACTTTPVLDETVNMTWFGILDASETSQWVSSADLSLPVSLVSFSASTEGRSIILEWVTESETDNLGFILERSAGTDWQTIASYQTHDELKGQGNTSSRTEYTFTDQTVESGKSYSYRLSDVSTKGEITVYASLSITMNNLPETTELEKAYPNPFNPQTFIGYKLAEDTDVNITVFDMLGRQVKILFNGHQFAGSYNVYWNATDETGNKVPSGGYIIQMKTEKTRQTQKVMLMK